MEVKETNKNKWIFYVLIFVLVGIVVFFLLNRTESSKRSSDKHLESATKHSDSAKVNLERYNGRKVKDSALERKYDSLVSEKQKIKIETNEKIRLVNQYSVSDMQYYFDERTKESGNP